MKLWLRGQSGLVPLGGEEQEGVAGPLQGTELACLGSLCQPGAAEQEGWPWGQTATLGTRHSGTGRVCVSGAHWGHTVAWSSLAATRTGIPAVLALHREKREAVRLKAG